MQPPLHAGSCAAHDAEAGALAGPEAPNVGPTPCRGGKTDVRPGTRLWVDRWCVIFHMPVPSDQAVTTRLLLRDEAYARLRDAILDGTLEAGEQLRDVELSAWLGISRTPIREALARLEDCGLVESAPNRYTRVAPLDRRDAQDAFQVVAALHALAATLGVPRVSDAELAAMRAANEHFAASMKAADVDAALAADDAFHAVLVTASANGEIA